MSLRCRIGFHDDRLLAGFPHGAPSPLIVGVQCQRCRRFRCANQMERPRMSAASKQAFAEAHAWLEKAAGAPVIGPFVSYR